MCHREFQRHIEKGEAQSILFLQHLLQFIYSLIDEITIAPADIRCAVHLHQAWTKMIVEFLVGSAFLEFVGKALEYVGFSVYVICPFSNPHRSKFARPK